jgi:hypothetical protein
MSPFGASDRRSKLKILNFNTNVEGVVTVNSMQNSWNETQQSEEDVDAKSENILNNHISKRTKDERCNRDG